MLGTSALAILRGNKMFPPFLRRGGGVDEKRLHCFIGTEIVERQNGKRGLESGFGSAGYVNGF